jgi:hypothetical protein
MSNSRTLSANIDMSESRKISMRMICHPIRIPQRRARRIAAIYAGLVSFKDMTIASRGLTARVPYRDREQLVSCPIVVREIVTGSDIGLRQRIRVALCIPCAGQERVHETASPLCKGGCD